MDDDILQQVENNRKPDRCIECVRGLQPVRSFTLSVMHICLHTLKGLKKLIHKPNFPLQQLANRLTEQNLNTTQTASQQRGFVPKKEHSSGPLPATLPHARQYKQLYLNSLFLSVDCGDNCVTLSSGSICVVHNILLDGSSVLLVVEILESCTSFSEYPLSSADVGIVHVARLCGMQHTVSADDVVCKNVCLPTVHDSFAIFPLLQCIV